MVKHSTIVSAAGRGGTLRCSECASGEVLATHRVCVRHRLRRHTRLRSCPWRRGLDGCIIQLASELSAWKKDAEVNAEVNL